MFPLHLRKLPAPRHGIIDRISVVVANNSTLSKRINIVRCFVGRNHLIVLYKVTCIDNTTSYCVIVTAIDVLSANNVRSNTHLCLNACTDTGGSSGSGGSSSGNKKHQHPNNISSNIDGKSEEEVEGNYSRSNRNDESEYRDSDHYGYGYDSYTDGTVDCRASTIVKFCQGLINKTLPANPDLFLDIHDNGSFSSSLPSSVTDPSTTTNASKGSCSSGGGINRGGGGCQATRSHCGSTSGTSSRGNLCRIYSHCIRSSNSHCQSQSQSSSSSSSGDHGGGGGERRHTQNENGLSDTTAGGGDFQSTTEAVEHVPMVVPPLSVVCMDIFYSVAFDCDVLLLISSDGLVELRMYDTSQAQWIQFFSYSLLARATAASTVSAARATARATATAAGSFLASDYSTTPSNSNSSNSRNKNHITVQNANFDVSMKRLVWVERHISSSSSFTNDHATTATETFTVKQCTLDLQNRAFVNISFATTIFSACCHSVASATTISSEQQLKKRNDVQCEEKGKVKEEKGDEQRRSPVYDAANHKQFDIQFGNRGCWITTYVGNDGPCFSSSDSSSPSIPASSSLATTTLVVRYYDYAKCRLYLIDLSSSLPFYLLATEPPPLQSVGISSNAAAARPSSCQSPRLVSACGAISGSSNNNNNNNSSSSSEFVGGKWRIEKEKGIGKGVVTEEKVKEEVEEGEEEEDECLYLILSQKFTVCVRYRPGAETKLSKYYNSINNSTTASHGHNNNYGGGSGGGVTASAAARAAADSKHEKLQLIYRGYTSIFNTINGSTGGMGSSSRSRSPPIGARRDDIVVSDIKVLHVNKERGVICALLASVEHCGISEATTTGTTKITSSSSSSSCPSSCSTGSTMFSSSSGSDAGSQCVCCRLTHSPHMQQQQPQQQHKGGNMIVSECKDTALSATTSTVATVGACWVDLGQRIINRHSHSRSRPASSSTNNNTNVKTAPAAAASAAAMFNFVQIQKDLCSAALPGAASSGGGTSYATRDFSVPPTFNTAAAAAETAFVSLEEGKHSVADGGNGTGYNVRPAMENNNNCGFFSVFPSACLLWSTSSSSSSPVSVPSGSAAAAAAARTGTGAIGDSSSSSRRNGSKVACPLFLAACGNPAWSHSSSSSASGSTPHLLWQVFQKYNQFHHIPAPLSLDEQSHHCHHPHSNHHHHHQQQQGKRQLTAGHRSLATLWDALLPPTVPVPLTKARTTNSSHYNDNACNNSIAGPSMFTINNKSESGCDRDTTALTADEGPHLSANVMDTFSDEMLFIPPLAGEQLGGAAAATTNKNSSEEDKNNDNDKNSNNIDNSGIYQQEQWYNKLSTHSNVSSPLPSSSSSSSSSSTSLHFLSAALQLPHAAAVVVPASVAAAATAAGGGGRAGGPSVVKELTVPVPDICDSPSDTEWIDHLDLISLMPADPSLSTPAAATAAATVATESATAFTTDGLLVDMLGLDVLLHLTNSLSNWWWAQHQLQQQQQQHQSPSAAQPVSPSPSSSSSSSSLARLLLSQEMMQKLNSVYVQCCCCVRSPDNQNSGCVEESRFDPMLQLARALLDLERDVLSKSIIGMMTMMAAAATKEGCNNQDHKAAVKGSESNSNSNSNSKSASYTCTYMRSPYTIFPEVTRTVSVIPSLLVLYVGTLLQQPQPQPQPQHQYQQKHQDQVQVQDQQRRSCLYKILLICHGYCCTSLSLSSTSLSPPLAPPPPPPSSSSSSPLAPPPPPSSSSSSPPLAPPPPPPPSSSSSSSMTNTSPHTKSMANNMSTAAGSAGSAAAADSNDSLASAHPTRKGTGTGILYSNTINTNKANASSDGGGDESSSNTIIHSMNSSSSSVYYLNDVLNSMVTQNDWHSAIKLCCTVARSANGLLAATRSRPRLISNSNSNSRSVAAQSTAVYSTTAGSTTSSAAAATAVVLPVLLTEKDVPSWQSCLLDDWDENFDSQHIQCISYYVGGSITFAEHRMILACRLFKHTLLHFLRFFSFCETSRTEKTTRLVHQVLFDALIQGRPRGITRSVLDAMCNPFANEVFKLINKDGTDKKGTTKINTKEATITSTGM